MNLRGATRRVAGDVSSHRGHHHEQSSQAAATSNPVTLPPQPWWYVTPVLTLMVVWVYLPLAWTVLLSVVDWNLTGPQPTFVGLDNYIALAGDARLHRSLFVTALLTVTLLPLVVGAPLLAAVVVWKRGGPLATLYRTMLFVPVLIPPGVGAIVWAWIFHPILGVANKTIGLVGIDRISWLTTQAGAQSVVVIVTAWKVFGLSFILFTAGLTSIDGRLLDAARIDGAREWEVTTTVILPLLRPTTVLVTLLCLIFAGQWSFAVVDVLTQGGPVGATNTLFYLLHQYAFRYFDTGKASALAAGMIVLFGGLALLQARLRRSRL